MLYNGVWLAEQRIPSGDGKLEWHNTCAIRLPTAGLASTQVQPIVHQTSTLVESNMLHARTARWASITEALPSS